MEDDDGGDEEATRRVRSRTPFGPKISRQPGDVVTYVEPSGECPFPSWDPDPEDSTEDVCENPPCDHSY